jgi:hypothetical protein
MLLKNLYEMLCIAEVERVASSRLRGMVLRIPLFEP